MALTLPPTWYAGSPVTPRGRSVTSGHVEPGLCCRSRRIGDLVHVRVAGHLQLAVRAEVGERDEVGRW